MATAPSAAEGTRWYDLQESRTQAVAVGVLTLAALVLHITQLHQTLFGDEVLAYREIAGHSLSQVVHTVATGFESSPPLFFILAWFSAKLGDPTVWIRLPTLVFGAATIPVVYLIAKETIGGRAGVVAAAIIALSPYATYYGVEARPYATTEFFVALSTLALLRAVRTDKTWWWVGYAVAAAAAAYSHYTAIFVLVVQGVWALWMCRHRLGHCVAASAGAVVLYIPWLPSLHGSALGAYAIVEPFTTHNVVTDLMRPIAGYPYAGIDTIPTIPGLAILWLAALTGVWALGRRYRSQRSEAAPSHAAAAQLPHNLGLLVAMALAAPVLLLLYSILGTDIWLARNLYVSAPAGALVLAALLTAPAARASAFVIFLVLATLLVGTVRAVSHHFQRPQYRVAAQYIDRTGVPGEPVIDYLSPLDGAIQVEMHHHPYVQISPAAWRSVKPGQKVFVVLDDVVGAARHIGTPHQPGFTLIARRHFTGLVWFTVFTYRRSG